MSRYDVTACSEDAVMAIGQLCAGDGMNGIANGW
jgi:hypothetical protein